MKAHGKGNGITINGGTSTLNRYKHDYLANVSDGVPVREWKPLKSWPARPHIRQAEIDQFCHTLSLVR